MLFRLRFELNHLTKFSMKSVNINHLQFDLHTIHLLSDPQLKATRFRLHGESKCLLLFLKRSLASIIVPIYCFPVANETAFSGISEKGKPHEVHEYSRTSIIRTRRDLSKKSG